MNIDNIPNEIFDLISEKKYEDLNTMEKETISLYLTQEEYIDAYSAIRDFQNEDAQLPIDKPGLMFKNEQPSTLYRVIHYKVPVYMIASSLVLFLCAYFLISQRSTKNEYTQENNATSELNEGVPIDQDNYPDDLVFEL